MGVTQYVGARYVPKFTDNPDGLWTNTVAYEPLTIVLYQGNSYTSRQSVPIGIDISNTEYWAETGNYNAQTEAYRKEVQTILPYDDTPTAGSTKGVESGGVASAISTETTARESADTTLQTNIDAVSTTLQTNIDAVSTTLQTNIDAVSNTLDAVVPLDTTPTANSTKGVTSGGVEAAISTVNNAISDVQETLSKISPLDSTPTADSTKGVESGSVYTAIAQHAAAPNMFAYGTPGNANGPIHLYISYDGYIFSDCGLISTDAGNSISADTKNVTTTPKYLYLIASGIIYKATTNLLTFQQVNNLRNDMASATGFSTIWGQSLMYNNSTNKLYTYAACSNSTSATNFTIYGCEIDPTTCKLIGTPTQIPLNGYDNVIDPHVIYYNNTYYMAFKDETAKKCYVATSNNPLGGFTPNTALFTHRGRGVEAPQILPLAGQLTIWVDGYSICADDDNVSFDRENQLPHGQCNGWYAMTTDALLNLINPARPSTSAPLYSLYAKMRHPAYLIKDATVMNLFYNSVLNPLPPFTNGTFATYETTQPNAGTYTVGNFPFLMRLTGEHELTLNYEQIIAGGQRFYIENVGPTTRQIHLNSGFTGGAETGRNLPNGDRQITGIFGLASAYPDEYLYTT